MQTPIWSHSDLVEIGRKVDLFIIGFAVYCAMIYPFASLFGKYLKRRDMIVDPYHLKDMTGEHLGMGFMVADLNHDASQSRPQQGDAIIILDICGMGMTVARDQRGNVTSEFSTPQEPLPGEPKVNGGIRAFDSFDVHINGVGDDKIKRYEFRPCGLVPRTWIVAR